MKGFRPYFIHQLHEEINIFQETRILGKNPPNPNGYDFERENAPNACTYSPQHDPSSQPSQLECKMQEIPKNSNQTLKS
jgi:hypothetical protein